MTLKDEEREVLIRHSKEKSREAIENVTLLINNEKFSLAVNQIYYGTYYMISALALKHHFSTSKHLQLIGWFNKTFVKAGLIDKTYGKWMREAYDNRVDGDYNVLSDFTQEEVEQAFEKMKEVIAAIEELTDA